MYPMFFFEQLWTMCSEREKLGNHYTGQEHPCEADLYLPPLGAGMLKEEKA